MKTLLLLLSLACIPFSLRAQISSTAAITIGSMHDIIDARSLGLGEGSVAEARDPGAWNSNPATLAGLEGLGISYGEREGGIGQILSYSAGAWLGTPVGNFALHYTRYDLGEFTQTFENGAIGGTFHAYNQTIALSYATDVLTPVALGATIKRFDERMNYVTANSSGLVESTPAFYVDLGAIVSMPGVLAGTGEHDSLHAGLALQHLGGGYDTETPGQTFAQPVGSWLRVGVGYDLALFIRDDISLLRASLTAEYRRLLNPQGSFQESQADSWGGGAEATIYDILSLRAGITNGAVTDFIGTTGELRFRYGAGLHLPLKRIGISLPIALGFDFAMIPDGGLHSGKDLTAFGVSISYTESLF